MKPIHKIAGIALILFLMFMGNVPLLPMQLVPEAQAFFGRGVAFVAGASLGAASSSAAASSAAASQQQAAMAQQQAAAAQQQTAAAQQQAAMAQAAASGKPLPLGIVVHALPAGCVSTPVGGEEYYYCGGNFYRAMFQGNTLVYVTAQPK